MNQRTRPFSPGADAQLGVIHKVLDHGEIELVDYMGTDEMLARIARVSTGSERQDTGILGFLVRHRHTSPIEFGKLVLRVKLPIFLARQWIRHRTGSFSERSMRYQPPLNAIYVPSEDYCQAKMSAGVKQGRGATMSESHAGWVREEMRASARSAVDLYEELAEDDAEFDYPGLAAELARSVLPLGTYTEWYWTTDAHNLMHWLRLRLDGHAQKEIRAYAEVIYQIFKAWLPALAEAFDTYVRAAVTFSAKELAALATTGLSASVLKPGDHGMSAGELSEFAAKLGRLMAASDSSDNQTGGGSA
jgi:thymidylate synthase (FAD)